MKLYYLPESFIGEEEAAVGFVIHEKVLGKDGRTGSPA